MIPEMFWKSDAAVEAARQMAGWREFHAACAVEKLFFDHIEKHSKQYVGAAFVGSGTARKVAEERAKTPVEAIAAAYRASGLRVAAAEPWLEMLLNPPPDHDEFGALLDDDFATLLED